jgi:hypothetical protein
MTIHAPAARMYVSTHPVERIPATFAYLDTCLVSGLVKQDIGQEYEPLLDLLQRNKAGALRLVTSHVAKEEIDKIPPIGGALHHVVYALLRDVPEAAEARTDGGLMLMGVGGGRREDPRFGELKTILRDLDDARHVFQAVANGVPYFVTVDIRTILSKASELEERFGVLVRRPSQLIAELEAPQAPDAARTS